MVITGLTRNQFVGLPARGKGAECQHSVLSGEAGNEASLLARNENRARSKRERRRLSERYRIPPEHMMFQSRTWYRFGFSNSSPACQITGGVL